MFLALAALLIVLGVLQMIYPFTFPPATGGIHQVYFAVLFGSGSITFGLGCILAFLNTIRPIAETAHSAPMRSASPKGKLATIYRQHDIRHNGFGYEVMGQQFAGIEEAKAAIDRREDGRD